MLAVAERRSTAPHRWLPSPISKLFRSLCEKSRSLLRNTKRGTSGILPRLEERSPASSAYTAKLGNLHAVDCAPVAAETAR